MQRLDDAIASVTGWAGGRVAWMELRSQPQRHPVLLLMDPVLWPNSSTQSIFSFKTSIPISQSIEGAEKCIVLISGIIWTLPGKGLLKALQDWCVSGRNQSKWAEQSQPPFPRVLSLTRFRLSWIHIWSPFHTSRVTSIIRRFDVVQIPATGIDWEIHKISEKESKGG